MSPPSTSTTGPPRQSQRTLSRRQLLQIGGLSSCASTSFGLSLPELLAAESASGSAPKSCIFIHQNGGLSQLDSWDPKPDAPDEIRGPYKPIATATPGLQVG